MFEVGLGEKVDLDAPSIDVDQANETYVSGDLSLVGNWDDDGDINSIIVSINGEVFSTDVRINKSAKSWSLEIPTDEYPDGSKELSILITDLSGKTTEKNLILYFDNHAPVVLVKEPLDFSGNFNKETVIRGEVADKFRIATVEVLLYDQNGDELHWIQNEADTGSNRKLLEDMTNSWSFIFDSETYTSDTSDFYFEIVATDLAGHSNQYYYLYSDLLDKNDDQSISVDEIEALEQRGVQSEGIILTEEALLESQKEQIHLWIDQNEDLPHFEFDTPSESSPQMAENPQAFGRVLDDDGVNVASIEISLNEGGWISVDQVPESNSTTASWSHNLSDLGEGIFSLQIRATDIYGISSESNLLDFVIDAAGPSMNIHSPDSGEYLNSAFFIEGYSSDNLGVKKIELSIDNGSYEPVITFDNSEGSTDLTINPDTSLKEYNWSFQVPLPDDGSHLLRVRSVDLGNKTSSESIQINIDTKAPDIEFTDLYGSTARNSGLNGLIHLKGTASDETLVKEVQYALVEETGTVSVADIEESDWKTLTDKYSWSVWIDSTELEDGEYAVFARAEDSSGNATSDEEINANKYNFTLLQSSDNPSFSFTNLYESGAAADNLIGFTKKTLSGKVYDDDGLDKNSVTITLVNGTYSLTEDVLIAEPAEGLTEYTWSYTLPDNATLPQSADPYNIILSASDVGESGGALSKPSVSSNSITLSAYLDRTLPELTETQIGTSDLQIHNQDVNFSGSVDDGNELSRLYISVNSGVSTDIPFDLNGNWSYSFPVAVNGTTDGTYELIITAEDTAGRQTSLTRSLLIDATAPQNVLIDPFSGSYQVNELVASGSAEDSGSGLALVQYSLDEINWRNVTGTGSWFKTVDISGLAEGTGTLFIRAEDVAGNISNSQASSFIIDRNNPELLVDAAFDGSVYRSDDFSINGTLADTLALSGNASSITLSVLNPDDELVDLSSYPLSYDAVSDPDEWEQFIPVDLDGEYSVIISAMDAAGRSSTETRYINIDSTPPSISDINLTDGADVFSSSYTVTGLASDGFGSGVEGVQYRLNDGNWEDASGTTSWNVVLTGLSDDLNAKLEFKTSDKAGNESGIETINFVIDTALPVSTISGVNNSFEYVNSEVNLSGTATDSNDIASVDVSYSLDGSAYQSLALGDTLPSWSANLPAGDGIYDIRVTVTDNAGRPSVYNRRVGVDTQSPTLTITAPAANEWLDAANNPYTLRGTVTDDGGKGVTHLEYSSTSDFSSDVHPIPLAGLNWSVEDVDFSTGGEGSRTLYFRTGDGLNSDVIENVTFYYDEAAPIISESEIGTTDTQYSGDDFVLSGLWTESNQLDEIRISYTKDGGASQAVTTLTPETSGTDETWTYTVPVDNDGTGDGEETGIQDGLYVFTITAEDSAGRSATLTRSIGIDTTIPTITPTASSIAGYQDESVSISGTAEDPGTGASGIEKVQYSFDDTNWFDANGTTNWSYNIDVSTLAEGNQTLYFRAVDKGHRTSNSDTTTIKVDHDAPRAVMSKTGTFTTISSVESTKDSFTLSGTADDAAFTANRAASSALLSFTKDGGSPTEITLTPVADGSWTWNSTDMQNDSSNVSIIDGNHDGLYIFTLIVEDEAGKTSTAQQVIKVDTTAPVLTVDSPVDEEAVSTVSYEIKGTTRDTGGVGFDGTDDVEYSFNGSDWIPLTLSGINWSDNTITLSDEGAKTLYVKTTDALGNSAIVNDPDGYIEFYFDLDAPSLTETSIGSIDTQYINNDFDLGGTWTESNELKNIVIEYEKNNSGTLVTLETINVGASGTNTAWSAATVDVKTGIESSEDALTDGNYEITITATDSAGRSGVITRNFVIDTVAPSVDSFTDLTGGWKNSSTFTVSGTASDDNSGIDTVKYSLVEDGTLDDEPWNLFSGASSFSSTISLNNGTLQMYFQATDKAGNTSDNVSQEINIDTVSPEIDTISPSDTTLINGTLDFPITLTASDANSGALRAEVYLQNDFTTAVATGNFSGNSATVTIPSSSLDLGAADPDTDGNYTIAVRVVDNAGNFSSSSYVNVILDSTAPTGAFSSHSDDDVVNGIISLSGTASDNHFDQPVRLEIQNAGDSSWDTVGEVTISGTYNWTIENFPSDSDSYYNATYDSDGDLTNGADYNLQLILSDEAGNEGTLPLSLTADKDTDRPVLKLNNLDLTDMADDNYIWLKQSNVIYGTVTDDDGIQKLEVSTNGGSTWYELSVSNGAWTYTVSDDNSYTIIFKVTDTGQNSSGSNEFQTSESDSYNVYSPMLTDNQAVPNHFGYLDDPLQRTAVYLTVDTQNPNVTTAEYFEDPQWSTSIASQVFGGDTDSVILRQYAFDANGIAQVQITLDSNVNDLPGAVYGYTATASTPTTLVGSDTYTPYEAELDISKLASGSRSVYITVTDNAGLSTRTTLSIVIDNSAPTVNLDSHIDNEQVSGSVTLKGTTSGSADSLIYIVTDSAAAPASWDVPLNGSDPDYTTYGAHEVLSALSSWRINFDDDINNGDGFTHDRSLKKYIVALNSDLEIAASGANQGSVVYKNAVGGHVVGDKYTDITNLYFHFKATDAYGNTDDTITYVLKVDPQGDIPYVEISYPAVSSYGWFNGTDSIYTASRTPSAGSDVYSDIAAATSIDTIDSFNSNTNTINVNGTDYTGFGGNTIIGGIIRIQGAAEDDKTISGIYLQIDPTYDPADGFIWTEGSAGAALLPDGNRLDSIYPGITTFASGKTGIEVGDSVAWSYTLNASGEFNGTSGTNNQIALRAFAVDIDGNVSSLDIGNDCIITIDSAVPRIGSSEPLYLYQYSDNANGTGTVVASQEYTDGMWLKGDWWLSGSVEDENGISIVTVDGADPEEKTAHIWNEGFSNQTSGFIFKKKIGSSTPDSFGSLSYMLYVEDGDTGTHKTTSKEITINFDNKAPVLIDDSDSNFSIPAKVVQSNGFYTLGSQASEDSSPTASQSGFARVALYFLRRGSLAENQAVYDTYLEKTDGDNKLAIGSLDYDSGLYWKVFTVGRSSNLKELTLPGADSNIHTGGIVKIGGTIYTITSVSGDIVTIDGSPTQSETSAKFAIAQIVDHKLTESNGSILGSNGYYTDVVNDDNDNMVEKVATQGGTSTWEANINSRNIPDGPIEIHYVAFDEAGNYSIGIVGNVVQGSYSGEDSAEVSVYTYGAADEAIVANNAPRLAAVLYGTDDNGDGSVSDSELIRDMFAVYTSGALTGQYDPGELKEEYVMNGGNSVLNIKGDTRIVPEIVGGNGTLYYSYNVTDSGDTDPYYAMEMESGSPWATGTDYSGSGDVAEILDSAEIYLSVADFLNADNSGTGTEIVDGDDQTFEFSFWDSTDECDPDDTTGRQNASLTMVMDVALRDNIKPTVVMSPFYWNSSLDNSIETDGNGNLMGHIELAGSAGRTLPAVSGTINLAGRINDNQRIETIKLSIDDGSYATPADVPVVTVANYDASTDTFTYPAVANITFSAQTESIDNTTGHTVSWSMTWDSSRITNAAAEDVSIQIIAEDRGSPSWDGSSVIYGSPSASLGTEATEATAYSAVSVDDEFDEAQWYYHFDGSNYNIEPVNASNFDNYVAAGDLYTGNYTNKPVNTVDVVPYIVKIETALSSLKKSNWSVFNRTAAGHYPVQNDEEILLYGFNLSGAQLGVSNLTIDNDDPYQTALVDVSAISASGALAITVNSISTLNNSNDDTAEYNQQHNGDNNDLLTDDLILDIWDINSTAAQPRSGRVTEPVMKINPNNGVIGFAFANGPDSFSMGNENNSYQWWQYNYDDFAGVSFAYDSNGNSHGIVIGRDIYASDGGYGGRMVYMTSKWGRSTAYDQTYDNFYVNRKTRLESIGIPVGATVKGVLQTNFTLDKTRLRSPSLAVASHGTGEAVYLAYYDNINEQVRFRYGSNTLADKTNNTGFDQFVDNSGYYNDTDGYVGDSNDGSWNQHRVFESYEANYSLVAGLENDNVTDTGNNPGEFVAIDVIPGADIDNDIVVIVWYDGTNLMYTYRYGIKDDINADSAGVANKWSAPLTIFEEMGKYCTVKADADGGIHIAAYDHLGGDLKYAYLSSYDLASSDDVERCTVDSYGIVGNNISIDVALNGDGVAVPYISYYMTSTLKPKIAYLLDPATDHAPDGVDIETDSFTGDWEISLIPTNNTVSDDNINIGVWKNASGVLIASTTGGSTSDTLTGTCYGNGTSNPVLGYAIEVGTSGAIETAQLK